MLIFYNDNNNVSKWMDFVHIVHIVLYINIWDNRFIFFVLKKQKYFLCTTEISSKLLLLFEIYYINFEIK